MNAFIEVYTCSDLSIEKVRSWLTEMLDSWKSVWPPVWPKTLDGDAKRLASRSADF
jgi:hypothetical protein